MKRKVLLFIIGILSSLVITGCGASENDNDDTKGKKDKKDKVTIEYNDDSQDEEETEADEEETEIEEEEKIDLDEARSWYTDNSMAIGDGVYVVGKDIKATNYLYECTDTKFSSLIVVFESEENYLGYQRADRFTNGEFQSAIDENAILSDYVHIDESIALNLVEGNVLLIKDGIGELSFSDSSETPSVDKTQVGKNVNVADGTYYVGDSIDSGEYMITCTDATWGDFEVIVFQTENDYNNFEEMDHFTVGEFQDDCEANAYLNYYLDEGECAYVGLEDGMVVMFINGKGSMQTVEFGWN